MKLVVALGAVALTWTIGMTAARADTGLVGTWSTEYQGVTMQLELRADGTAVFVGAPCRWKAGPGTLTLMTDDGESEQLACERKGDTLRVSGGSMPVPLTFRRVGSTAPPGRSDTPAKADKPGKASKQGKGKKAAPGTGARQQVASWPGSFERPMKFQVFDKDGVLILKSETEPGAVLIRVLRGQDIETLRKGFAGGLTEDGLRLAPIGVARAFTGAGHKAYAGDMSGTAADGTELRARAVAVSTGHGDAAVVLGLASPADIVPHAAMTDAVARSLSFDKPPRTAATPGASPGGGGCLSPEQLAGSWMSECGRSTNCMSITFYGDGTALIQSWNAVMGNWSSRGTWSLQCPALTVRSGRDVYEYTAHARGFVDKKYTNIKWGKCNGKCF